ncbi:elongation of very long chain fatty acids protein AAEL008004-like [Pectinophora gossypiella]|uniref:elongation of very long chain fatty acids protein AAEL008004-like n=1 Tax=Pectinophora gossypiella TaxID=13191 RepID=UPI00214F2DB9|nr:elongation of very long chain fatty acids protein AAEL008004-like [Pectinophora gossypiella]
MLVLLAAYHYFCQYAGPKFMKKRKPYQLKNTLIVYNIFQIFMSIFIVYSGGVYGWFTRYNFNCQPVDWSENPDPNELRVAELVWWYYFCKLTELLDTVFFVLRKKDNQVTTLHLYHHTIMPIFSWIGLRLAPGGHSTLLGWINSFVHIIMYTYYLVAGLGPQYQKYLWWKKYLTSIQLIQFCIVFWHNFSVLFRDCAYPKTFNVFAIVESVTFIYMFGKFYYYSYVKNKKKTK